MDKRLTQTQKISHAYYLPFLAIFIISGTTCLLALRQNNSTMISLRQDVYMTDKGNGNVNSALDRLRNYVYGHMNTNLSTGSSVKPPIQLQYTYARLELAAQAQSSNAGLYTDAENYCQSLPGALSYYVANRVACVTKYVTNHGGTVPAPIAQGLYEFDFASPAWSPDLAGWSLVIAILSGLGAIISFLLIRFKR